MSESLANLQKGDKDMTFPLLVRTTGSGNGEKYGEMRADTHPYSKLKVVSYLKIENSYTGYPRIDINGVQNNRPAIGTVFDIKGKSIKITALTSSAVDYTETGVNIELS